MSDVKAIIQKIKMVKPISFLKSHKKLTPRVRIVDKRRLRKQREKQKNEEEKQTKRNFLPTLLLTFVLWLLLVSFVYFVDPASFGAVPAFFVLSFLALLFTFSIILGDKRRGTVISVGISMFMVLRLVGLGNVLNLLLIAGIVTSIMVFIGNERA